MHVDKQSILTANGVQEFKIVVVGPRRVGKSASVVRFLTKRFISEYVENTDMSCKRVAEVDGEALRVNIQDTSDKGMRLSSVEHHFRWADAIMMVYSITDRDGFCQLKETVNKIMEKINNSDEKEQSRIPGLVVVGNKGDLAFVRKVSRTEGVSLAEKLRCDFFEASAREGWSKCIAKAESSPPACSPSSDSDTISLFAGASANVGLVGLPCGLSASPNPLSRERSPARSDDAEDSNDSEFGSLKSLPNFNSTKPLRRHTRSNSTVGTRFDFNRAIPEVNVSKTFQRLNSVPCGSSGCSENDSDDTKSSGFLMPPKTRKFSSPGGLIGRLSPRLGRRFSRSAKIDENEVKQNFRDDNNNRQRKSSSHNVSLGLSPSFLASPRIDENVYYDNQKKMFSGTNSSCGNSSTSTSTTGSTESLVACGQDLEIQQDTSVFVTNTGETVASSSPLSPPILKLPCDKQKFLVQEFGSSEPFLHLCRGRTIRTRSRSRSPSHKIMNGLKKIRSLASDHNSQSHNNNRQQVNSTLLNIPVIKL